VQLLFGDWQEKERGEGKEIGGSNPAKKKTVLRSVPLVR
jgi:hypothetical protein